MRKNYTTILMLFACASFFFCSQSSYSQAAENCAQPDMLEATNIMSTSAELNWTDMGNTWNFQVAFKESASTGFWTIYNVAGTGSGNSLMMNNLTPSTEYKWKVRDLCGPAQNTMFGWTETYKFKTADPVCGAATDLMTLDITFESAILSWTDTADVPNWQVAYRKVMSGTGATWSTAMVPGTGSGSNSMMLGGLETEVHYEWKVRDKCYPTSAFGWSIPDTFMTTPFPCSPPMNLMSDNVTHHSADLMWMTDYPVDSFQVSFRLADGSTDWGTVSSGSGSAMLTNLLPESDYEWRVRDKCDGGISVFGWTTPAYFTTLAEPVGRTNLELASSLEVFPNPFTNQMNVRVSLKRDELVEWTLIDVRGTAVLRGTLNGTKGMNELQVEGGNLPAGLYIWQMSSHSGQSNVKLLKN